MRTLTSCEYDFVAGGTDAQVDDAAGLMTVAAAGCALIPGGQLASAALLVGAGLIEVGGAIGDLF